MGSRRIKESGSKGKPPPVDRWTQEQQKNSNDKPFTPDLAVTVKNVLDHLAAIAFHDKRNAQRADGTPKPLRELDAANAVALQSVEYGPNGTQRYKYSDRLVALELLGKYLRLFNSDTSDVKQLDDLLSEYRKRYTALTTGTGAPPKDSIGE